MRAIGLIVLTLVSAILLTTLSGCGGGQSGGGAQATIDRLAGPVDRLADAAAGDDWATVRRAAREVIATYDAGVGE